MSVSRYIHLNPAAAGLLDARRPVLKSYPWSSFPALCNSPSKRPPWLEAAATYRVYELKGDDAASRRKYQQCLELAARETMHGELSDEEDAQRRQLLRGWYIGKKTFRDRLLDSLDDAVKGRKKSSFTGSAISSHDEEAARKLIRKALKHLKIKEADLLHRRRNDWEKQMITALLRKGSGVSYAWIGKELNMGSRGSIYNAILRVRDETNRQKKKQWEGLQKLCNLLH